MTGGNFDGLRFGLALTVVRDRKARWNDAKRLLRVAGEDVV